MMATAVGVKAQPSSLSARQATVGPEPVQQIGPYLSAEQLAVATPWTVDAIEKMVARGVLVKDVHFFQPFGRRSQRIFKWSAIEALIEGAAAPVIGQRVVHGTPPPAPTETIRRIDVEKATTDLQRLLD